MSSPDRVALDHSDHWLGEVADQLLELEDIESWDLVIAQISPISAHTLVAPRAEGQVSGPGQDHDPDIPVIAHLGEGIDQLYHRLWPKGVAEAGPVDRDLRDPVGLLVYDIFVVACVRPIHGHTIGYWSVVVGSRIQSPLVVGRA